MAGSEAFSEEDQKMMDRLLSNPIMLPIEFKKWLVSYLESHPPALLISDLIGNQVLQITQYDVVPAAGFNGQVIRFQNADMLANGEHWLFVYNGASASTYKWEFIGGAALYAEVITQETTTSPTFTALATAGPVITLPLPGDYYVDVGAWVRPADEDDWTAWMSYDIGATAATEANALRVTSLNSGAQRYSYPVSKRRRKDGLTAVALTAKYKAVDTTPGEEAPPGGAASAGTWADRWISAIPIRVKAA